MDQSEQATQILRLEAELELLREIVRAVIARHPPDRVGDGPLMAAIQKFNKDSEQLAEPQKTARKKAWQDFRFDHISRNRV